MKNHSNLDKVIKTMLDDGWASCPMSKNIYRKIAGYDENDLPIIWEIELKDLRECNGNLKKCLELKFGSRKKENPDKSFVAGV